MDVFFAHSRTGSSKEEWQDLRSHLEAVAALASNFAPPLWKAHARMAGLWHDAGTYQFDFQRYIESDPEASNENRAGKVQHAIAGSLGEREIDSLPIALAVQAHYGALKSLSGLEDAVTNAGKGLLRVAERDGLPPDVCDLALPALPAEKGDTLYVALANTFSILSASGCGFA